jgi:hypothetical protein
MSTQGRNQQILTKQQNMSIILPTFLDANEDNDDVDLHRKRKHPIFFVNIGWKF